MAHLDPVAVAIGTAVRSAITEAGMTLTSTCEAAGYAPNTFSRHINGHQCFDLSDVVRISAVTGVSVGDIVARFERLIDKQAA